MFPTVLGFPLMNPKGTQCSVTQVLEEPEDLSVKTSSTPPLSHL